MSYKGTSHDRFYILDGLLEDKKTLAVYNTSPKM